MAKRTAELQRFLDAADASYAHLVTLPKAREAISTIFRALQTPAPLRDGPGDRLPTCQFLEEALSYAESATTLRTLCKCFRDVEPQLRWRRRTNNDSSASDNFPENHANALICGPGGLEERSDVWVGVSLLAPHVRYPNHRHQPEEVYLFLSEGEFLHGDTAWFTPGLGATPYNPSNIVHAMRSGDQPLLALWVLNARP
jgi:hypothetical protein